MVNMIKITKALTASAALGFISLVALTGCATSKTAGTQPSPKDQASVAPMAQNEPKPTVGKTLSQTREIPDGGLSPVAEAPQSSAWGSTFMPPGN